MKVGDGNFGSRFSRISLALFVESFLRQRSTEAAAASSWNRSMIVVAVKSGHISEAFSSRWWSETDLGWPPLHDLGSLERLLAS